MLGGFITFNQSGTVYGAALASGVDPTNMAHIEKSAKGTIKTNSKLKLVNSPDTILKNATINRQLEVQNDLMKQASDVQIKGMRAAVERLRIGRQHRKAAMGIETDFQKEMAGVTEDLLAFRMATGMIQAESVGTQKAYKSSRFAGL
jgi:hypothetical protein